MRQILSILVLIFVAFPLGSYAQTIQYDNVVYQPFIRSVQTIQNGANQNIPILRLRSSDYLVLQFDDLMDDGKDIFYKVIHCDRNWKPTNIMEIEYLEGFNDEPIRKFDFSINTLVPYVHYALRLPNRDTQFKISGNYILYIYTRKNGDIPLVTRRFVVAESFLNVGSRFAFPNDVENIRFKQQIDLSVNMLKTVLQNPMRDVSISVIQNGNWDLGYLNVEPTIFDRITNSLNFGFISPFSFWGLQEFRFFDTRSVLFRGLNVANIKRTAEDVQVVLKPDRSRYGRTYGFYFDFNGNYFVDNFDFPSLQRASPPMSEADLLTVAPSQIFRDDFASRNFETNEKDLVADYVFVEFNYEVASPYLGDMYVYGALSDWKLEPNFKMEYDYAASAYRLNVELKQGYYNYMYALKKEDGTIDFLTTEGSWMETDNEYSVIVYLSEPASRYDRVAFTLRTNSAPPR